MKKWLQFLATFVISATIIGSTGVASAQGRWPYSPSRPTFSPYHGLHRINTGGIPNYYAFVRRDEQLRRFVWHQEDTIQSLEHQLQTRETTATTVPSSAATFLNFSHFYLYPTPARR